ncbi:MAG: hypothetical protein M5U28_41820 [Sandaracinaceae bacterium]|nr:hypothetical protein [Sandaracinaceae bacterium]
MSKARRLDLWLYGTAGVLAIVGVVLAVGDRPSAEPAAAPAPSLDEEPEAPAEDEPRFVPSLPEVPDLATQPPPAREEPAEEDPRFVELGAEMRFLSRARALLDEHPRRRWPCSSSTAARTGAASCARSARPSPSRRWCRSSARPRRSAATTTSSAPTRAPPSPASHPDALTGAPAILRALLAEDAMSSVREFLDKSLPALQQPRGRRGGPRPTRRTLAAGGKMMVTLAGAMSTARIGRILSRMIRAREGARDLLHRREPRGGRLQPPGRQRLRDHP